MKKITKKSSSSTQKSIRPATTPEARERQLINLAVDLVEQRLIDGTASSQETTHFLKLGSTKNQLDLERAKLENELIKAKTDNLKSQERLESLYEDAIKAMQRYSGYSNINEDEEYEDED